MRQLRAGLLRLASLFNIQKHDREMAAEIESHLQMHIEDNLRAGMAADEARRQAIMKLGGIEATQEKCRDRRGVPMIENLLKDLRFGVRMLKKSPGFTSVAVLTLGLGIGANTAVFSIVNAVLLRPLPLPHGERVASIQVTPTVAGETTGPVSPNQFRAWMVDKTKFERLAAARGLRGQISGTEAPEEIRVLQVSPEFQELAGLRPYLGRTFLEDDFRRGATRTCLISYRLWQRSFSEDRSIVGRTCYLDSEATVIIGVLPHDLGFPDAENDIWTVLLLAPENTTQRFLDVYGRLA
ncbi:MAG TPA: ABC transporter permease, partial [Terriglobia bacterium]|nr:ABC transporter permease [Terriglobia bacterium]